MLRRFRKRSEYNEVDYCPEQFQERVDGYNETNRRAPQHELLDEPPRRHEDRIDIVPTTIQPFDNAAPKKHPPNASNLLNSIHVQVIPPSSVKNARRGNRRQSDSLERLNRLSAELQQEAKGAATISVERNNSVNCTLGNEDDIDIPTASISSTRSSRTSAITSDSRKLQTRKCHITNDCQPLYYSNPCLPFPTKTSLCLSPFHNNDILHAVSTDDNGSDCSYSRFDETALGKHYKVSKEDSTILSSQPGAMSGALEHSQPGASPNGVAGGCSGVLLTHAFAYHPRPPKRRYRSGIGNEHDKQKSQNTLNRTQSAEVRECAAKRGRDAANAEFITGRAIEKQIVDDVNHGDCSYGSGRISGVNTSKETDDDSSLNREYGGVEMQLSNEFREEQLQLGSGNIISDESLIDCKKQHEEAKLENNTKEVKNSSSEDDTIRRPNEDNGETTTIPALTQNKQRKLPVLLRAISPVPKTRRTDPAGVVSVLPNSSPAPKEGGEIRTNNNNDSIRPKPNLLRRALLTTHHHPKRSPSPRRPSPPADRLSPVDGERMIRGVLLRRSPSPVRECGAEPPGLEPGPPEASTMQQPLSKFRRALTPKRSPTPSKRRFFSRNRSAAREQRVSKEDTAARKGDDPPPDPPGSPSWKVAGKYSPNRRKKSSSGETTMMRQMNNGRPGVLSEPCQRDTVMKKDAEPTMMQPGEKEASVQATVEKTPEATEKQSESQQRNVADTEKMPRQQKLNSHQRRNYQQYVMMQKQKSRRVQSQKDKRRQAASEPIEPRNRSAPHAATHDHKVQRQIEQEKISESTNVKYQMAQSSKSKNTSNSTQKKDASPSNQQPPEPSQPESDADQNNLKDPVQLKKVLSSPSVMISTLTSQTMNTTNTTTTSKFWDGVEGYQPSNQTNHITPPDRNVSFETGLHGNPKKFDNITEEDVVILKKLNEKNKELQEFFQVHKVDENGRRHALQSQSPPRTKMEAQLLTPASPNGSAMESAFSLNLPMNKMGYFDDSDISALAMGDSATVYHMRASAEAKKNSSDYWREKYEKLKEETRRANQLRGMNEVLLEEDEDNFLRMEKSKFASSPRVSSTEKRAAEVRDVVDEDQTQFLQQQKLLLRCGGYMGGKKAKGVAVNRESGRKHQKKKVEPTRPAKSIFSRAQCFMSDEEGNSVVESMPRRPCQNEITRKVSSDEEIEVENVAKRLQCTRLVVDKQHIQDERHVVPEVEVIANRLQCNKVTVDEEIEPDRTNQQRDGSYGRPSPTVQVISETFTMNDEPVNTARPGSSLGFESLNSDLRPLQPIGFVQRMETPSPHLNRIDASPEEADGLNCFNDPVYVMDDADALKEWNKSRQPKALADELSAAASRGKASSAASSELSEDAKLIFEAALKHDLNALREQRSRSASRTPTKIRRASPVQSFEVSATSSAFSDHFASNIPQDYASWFELPSPGTSCITLIPILKGHLRNAVVVELLSSFDGASHKTDAKGVHRITPRHRVGDTLNKSLTEYLDSPAIASKTSMDSEYMGPIIADGEDGSIRFADASIHLGGISDAATSHIKKREFQDAIDIYSTLLRSMETMSGWLVGQLIASTIHNLCVLHLWMEEYDLALPFAKECIRLKLQVAGDNFLLMHSWANLGLIHYVLESHSSAVMAFRNAINISEEIGVGGEASLTGRLQNNLGCVNVEIGNIEGALIEFEQSLQCQKNNASSNDVDTSDAENLLSISMTIFNIGATCARQKHYQTALKRTEASHAMQEALLGTNSELVDNTLFYLNLLKKVITSSQSPDRNTPRKVPARTPPELSPSRAITRKDVVLDILDVNPESPERRIKQALVAEAEHQYPIFAKSNEIIYPMISLGSLKVEATPIERVRECLDRYDNTLRNSTDRRANSSIGRSLLCRKPPYGNKQPGIPSKLMNFGVKTLRKLEVQTELNDNLDRYGPRHPLVGQSHHSLGLVLLCIENYQESIDHFSKSIRINTHALGSKHSDIASSLMFMALAQFALERYEDAAASMLQVRNIRECDVGAKHNEIYQILNNLACVQFELGSLKQAESLLQEALDLQREVFRTEPEFLKGVSTVLFNIGYVHAKNGAFPKALIELEGALQIRQDILFEDATTGDITENMAYILAIHQLQNGSGNIDDITNEYISMLQKK